MQGSPSPTPESCLPLSEPVFQILISLAARDLHGYAIMREVVQRTGGRVTLSTSTLYGALQRMMRDRFVERSEERADAASGDELVGFLVFRDLRSAHNGGAGSPVPCS